MYAMKNGVFRLLSDCFTGQLWRLGSSAQVSCDAMDIELDVALLLSQVALSNIAMFVKL
jgi:hypothetical protein